MKRLISAENPFSAGEGQHLITSLIVSVVFSFISCCSGETDFKPPPTDLAARNAALEEVKHQFDVLKNADEKKAVELLKHKDDRVRARAARRLGELGAGAAGAAAELVQALHDQNRYVRLEAADALGYVDSPLGIEPLIRALFDSDRKVRLWAGKGLRRLGDKAVKVIIEHFSSDSRFRDLHYKDEMGNSFSLRRTLREQLAIMGEKAVPPLVEGLKDERGDIRANCVVALGELKQDAKAAILPLIEILENDEDNIREFAARTLGAIGDLHPALMPALKRAQEDKNKKVAGEARKAVNKLSADAKKKTPKKKG